MSGFIYELDGRPVCKRGYSVGARTAARFPKPAHVSVSCYTACIRLVYCTEYWTLFFLGGVEVGCFFPILSLSSGANLKWGAYLKLGTNLSICGDKFYILVLSPGWHVNLLQGNTPSGIWIYQRYLCIYTPGWINLRPLESSQIFCGK